MLKTTTRLDFLSAGLRAGIVIAAAVASFATTARAQTYSNVIIFGDSLSDVGNFAHKTQGDYGISYPGSNFNYSDHRFTNSSDTDPGSAQYVGVWHEQLTRRFLNMAPATNSRDGGFDYAFGDAETLDGTRDVTIESTPFGNLTVTIDNMGKQVSDYLAKFTPDANALYILWGGANDLFNDHSDQNVTGTADRVGALMIKLAEAGARTIIVPNLPPLGDTPEYNTNANDQSQLNAAAASYRDQLNAVLDSSIATLSNEGITVKVIRLDVYQLFLNLIANPTLDGFINTNLSVQGSSKANPDQYLFWDNVHPTTAGHNQIAQAAAALLPGAHPSFFNGEAQLDGDISYLAFSSGTKFGYYSYQYYPYLYSFDLGFEYVFPTGATDKSVYLYDFGLQSTAYTSQSLYPYIYNFNESAWYYYYTGTTNPRSFYDFRTGKYVYSTNN